MSKPVPSKEEVNEKIGTLLRTTELSAREIVKQVLGKDKPVQAELQLVYSHPEWKARKERATKKRLEELKPPTPPEEGKEPEIEVEKLPPTKPPLEKEEEKEKPLIPPIVAGKPLEKGMFTRLLNSGFEFLCEARPHLKRPSPASVENLDDALVDFLNKRGITMENWPEAKLIIASLIIAFPMIKEEWSHRREAKKEKPKKEEEKKPEVPSKEASVTVPTTPTGEGSVTLTATPPPPETEKPDWYYKLKGEQPPT